MSAFDRVSAELVRWRGIETRPGRFGAVAFHYGSREVGHLHGSSHADLPFPTLIRNEMVSSGAAQAHHFLPQSGWVTVPMQRPEGEALALAAFARNYDLIVHKKQVAETREPG